jgi:hypothetical protein
MSGQANPSDVGLFRALKGRGAPDDFMALCPAHRDVNPSLHVTTTKDGATLVYCFAGCTQDAVIDALRDKGLWPEQPRNESRKEAKRQTGEIVAKYDYTTADGKLAHQTLRLEPKSFRQRRPAPEDGLWIWGLTAGDYMRTAPANNWIPYRESRFSEFPIERERTTFGAANLVLYRLPDVIKAVAGGATVYITEGEKDADNIAALGFVATTCAMGAGKWRAEYNEPLRGADVVLLPHNDDPGRDHAGDVAAELHGVAKRVRLLDIAEHWSCGAGQDVSDWLASGATADKLKALVEALPDWQPSGEKPAPAAWPQMDPAAFQGLAGEVVKAIEPHSEADPVAILIQFLTVAGNLMGRTAYYRVEDNRHHANLYVLLVGESAKARKGTSLARVRAIVRHADEAWSERQQIKGRPIFRRRAD